MEKKPEWMSDPLVKDISLNKLEFLGSLVTGGKGKSQKELMSFFMLRMKEARQADISFSKDEVARVIEAIRLHSTREELEKMNEIMKKAPTS